MMNNMSAASAGSMKRRRLPSSPNNGCAVAISLAIAIAIFGQLTLETESMGCVQSSSSRGTRPEADWTNWMNESMDFQRRNAREYECPNNFRAGFAPANKCSF